MILCRFECVQHLLRHVATKLNRMLMRLTRLSSRSLVVDTAASLTRSKRALLVENALLRQQLLVLRRQIARPQLSPMDRFRLVLLAAMASRWKQTLLIVQPDTLLRWHREGFRLFWKTRSTRSRRMPRMREDTIILIRQMAAENPLWGAERVRGDLLKLEIRVSKRTVQKYMRSVRPRQRSGQTWRTFLHNHAHETWACDVLLITDVCFRQLFAFFIIELGSRRVVHVGVTRHPTDAWMAQQLREATPWGERPCYLLRDNDSKYGAQFARVAATSQIEVLRTPVRAPRANAICERFLGSVGRECPDRILILNERQLGRVLREYVDYFNHARPHQGLTQAIPAAIETATDPQQNSPVILSVPILGGLHHDYRLAA